METGEGIGGWGWGQGGREGGGGCAPSSYLGEGELVAALEGALDPSEDLRAFMRHENAIELLALENEAVEFKGRKQYVLGMERNNEKSFSPRYDVAVPR
jgi:hypothetical protein